MLADAFAAERLRLSKAWGTVFWGFLFVPVVSIVLGVIQALFMAFMIRKAGGDPAGIAKAPIDLGSQAIQALGVSDFFLVQLFFMIGAASILASDYRWETWRLLTPRNTRTNLMLGKLAAFGLATALGLVVLAAAGLISGLLGALIVGSPVILSRDLGALPVQLLGGFITSWLELLALAGVAACAAVITRNGLAAILVPVALWIVQAVAIGQLRNGFPNPGDPPLQYLAFLPALCTDVMRTALQAQAEVRPDATPFALLFLLVWIAALWALAVWLFRRQDLTRE